MTPDNTRNAEGRHDSLATGLAIFAALVLIVVGTWQVLIAITALANDEILVTTPKWVFRLDLTTWGWIHLLLGAVMIVVGVFVIRAAKWAAYTAVALAAVSAIVNFTWLPYYPVWSVIVIAADVAIIWALATHPTALRRDT